MTPNTAPTEALPPLPAPSFYVNVSKESPRTPAFDAEQMNDHWRAGFEAGRTIRAGVTVAEAITVVRDAMKADPGYAWSWHCNIAMSFVDEGGDYAVGNHAAARFLRSLAGVEPAHELPLKVSRAGDAAADGVWVPREPTQAMLSAGLKSADAANFTFRGKVIQYDTPQWAILKAAYESMLAAAPQPTRVDKGEQS